MLLLGFPTGAPAATATAPEVATLVVSSTNATTAQLEGSINPEGLSTTYAVQYDLATSDWCSSGGSTGSPASTTTATDLGFTDDNFHLVTADLSGLTQNTEYCAQLIATNSSGTGTGGQAPWTQGIPGTDTAAAFSTSATTATVQGEVDPAGQTTTYKIVYDTAASDWCTSFGSSGNPAGATTPQTLGFTDGQFHDVSVSLSGLTGGIQYCAEVVATNSTGSTPNDDGDQVPWTQGTPTAFTSNATSTGGTTATVEGQVNPAGQTTTYKIVYDTAASDWCTSFGSSGLPAHSTTSQSVGLTDSTFHDVSVNLSGLTAGTEYCAEIVATNGSGSTPTDDSDQVTWTQLSASPTPAPACVVPKVKGKTLAAARREIKKAHCGVGKVTRVKSSRKNKGHVISQSPKPGKHLKKGSKVALKIGK